MCTVVTSWAEHEPVRILALRDEFVSRAFDGPDEWWPAQPGVVGGRDQLAGGSWCVTDVHTGVTALVLNRTERRSGTPSRGVLPLAAVAAGASWPERVGYHDMASFNLVLAGPEGVSVWTWDTERLHRADLDPGVHMVTSRGVDTDDPKTVAFGPRFATEPWRPIVTSTEPSDEIGALIVRHPIDDDVYATVFAQEITAQPGKLAISSSSTPWRADAWTDQRWP